MSERENILYCDRDGYDSECAMHKIYQENKEKHKELLEELIKDTPSSDFKSPRYITKDSPFTMNEKSISNIEKSISRKVEQEIEVRKQEISRQEEWREFSSCLLQFFCSVIAPFLLMGLLAFIAVYFF